MKRIYMFLFAICMLTIANNASAFKVTNPTTDSVVYLSGDKDIEIAFYADRTYDYIYFGKTGFTPATATMSYSLFGVNPGTLTKEELANAIKNFIDPNFGPGQSITLEWTAAYVLPSNANEYATNRLKIKFIRDYFDTEPFPYTLIAPANKATVDITGADNSKKVDFKWNGTKTNKNDKFDYTIYIDSVTSDFTSDPNYFYTIPNIKDTFKSITHTDIMNNLILALGIKKGTSLKVKWRVQALSGTATPAEVIANQDFELTINYNFGVGINDPIENGMNVYHVNNNLYIKNQSGKYIKTLEVFDLSGNMIYNKPVNFQGENMIVNIPSDLSAGLYIYKLNFDGGSTSGKFVSQK